MITRRPLAPEWLLRYACLVTALANMGGNVAMGLFYKTIFRLVGAPLPTDLHDFALGSVLSFCMGAAALAVFLAPEKGRGLLAVGIVGKGLYAVITYYFWAVHGLHPFFMAFVVWDALFVVVFFLYWIKLASPELVELQQEIFDGIEAPKPECRGRALLLGFSITGTGSKALDRLEKGLKDKGYTCKQMTIVPVETIFTSPLSFLAFVRICARAFVRIPAKIEPLDLCAEHSHWDLVVVESPTWLLGMAAPVEAVLASSEYRKLFLGRDAVVLSVARGAYQRTLAMMVRRLELAGANVIAARGLVHPGREPRRLMSLWFYLIFRRPDFPPWFASKTFGLSEETLSEVENLGRDLADRKRTRPHWTLLMDLEAPIAPNTDPAPPTSGPATTEGSDAP